MVLSHEDLIAELPKLADLSASERKKLNDSRRATQIDAWRANELKDKDCPSSPKSHPTKRRKTKPATHFDPGLVLLNCAALGDVEGVKRLLNQGVNPNVTNVDRITPIHQSCLENDVEITKLLIAADCDIDSLDNELWTPLHAAVSLANVECVKLLLQYGANQLSPNVDGQLPIDLCEDDDTLNIMELELQSRGISQNELAEARTSQETKFFNEVKQLLERGGNADFQLLDNDATLLHVAAANGYVEVALYLLSKACKVDIQDIDGWSPIHAAAFWEEVDIIELLAAHGANFKLRTFCGELPSDLTEDEDIKNLLQRLTERTELMKKHTGAILRPSSVRGRLVSRMTTGEREDKRRESAELHNVFVEQIEQDISKAPDSWRVRTGKYTRSALRDINFEQQQPTEYSPEEKTPPADMSDGSQRPSLDTSNSLSENTDYVLPQSEPGLFSICENGEHKEVTPGKNITEPKKEQVQSPTRPFVELQQSVDDSTFELISPSTDSVDSDAVWANSLKLSNKENSNRDFPLNMALRKEKSFDDIVNTSENDFCGAAQPLPSCMKRSTSLVQTKERKPGDVKRFYSFRTDMQEPIPRFSPKLRNNKTAYKNRKKVGSSASKHSSAEEDALTNSAHSSADNACLVALLPTSPQETDESLKPLKVVGPGGDSGTDSTTPADSATHAVMQNHPLESSSIPDNSMDTHAGSLDRPLEPAGASGKEVPAQAEKKSTKCCVIL